jgi:separase
VINFILIFRYIGHGSGYQYFPSVDVRKLRVNAFSILMGCSTGNLCSIGEFEPYGASFDFILAGSPSVIGNLWDVTCDIDDLMEDFLKSWINFDTNSNIVKKNDSSNICTHLSKARNRCSYSHLTGAAPVIFGMPLR